MALIQHIPLSHFIILCVAVATLALLAARHLYETASFGLKKPGDRTWLYASITALTTVAWIAMVMFAVSCSWLDNAFSHGMEPEKKNTPIGTVLEYTALSPVETTLPSDYAELQGKLIIYFRFGCKDCLATHEEMMQALADVPSQDIYFVSTRSEQGKKLRETYPVPETPSGLYICHEPAGEQLAYILFYKDENDESVFDQNAMDKLISLYRKQS